MSEITSAATLVELAEAGAPGFDAVRSIVPEWRKAVTDFAGALDAARGPLMRKQRLALKRMSARVTRRTIDFRALAAQIRQATG